MTILLFRKIEVDISKLKTNIRNLFYRFFITYSEPVLSEYEGLTPNSDEDYRVARRLDAFSYKMIEILKDSLMK